MINMLLGPPGGGKSFEAVVFHVLPALRLGRKVITNLPLNVDEISKISPCYRDLIVLKHDMVEVEQPKRSWNPFHRAWDNHKIKTRYYPFGCLKDYGDTWRHSKTGAGPLYVIDECHKPLPAKGTPVEVEEWFAEHRHEFADVLLISQSAGKVSKAITDSIQVVYRVRKATALGTNDSYIRKVQDGLRGEVVNEGIRKYKPEFFSLYKSHTRSDGAGAELAAADIVPFWKRWPVIGAGVCFVGALALLIFGKASVNPMKSAQAAPVQQVQGLPEGFQPVQPTQFYGASAPVQAPAVSAVPAPATAAQAGKAKQAHPFDGLSIHIVSYLESGTKWRYSFSADQNGQPTFMLTQDHLEKSGYTVEKLSECSAKIIYGDIAFFATCDTKSVGMARDLMGNQ